MAEDSSSSAGGPASSNPKSSASRSFKKKIKNTFASLYDDDEVENADAQVAKETTASENYAGKDKAPDKASKVTKALDDLDDPPYGIVSLRYSDECLSLPVTRPVGYPHIIYARGYIEKVNFSPVRFADGVATFLWRWNQNEFDAFFDLSKPKYVMKRVNAANYEMDLYVTRKDRLVVAGFHERDHGFWDPQVKFYIEDDGKWNPRPSLTHSDPQDVEDLGKDIAHNIFVCRHWEEYEGKITIESGLHIELP